MLFEVRLGGLLAARRNLHRAALQGRRHAERWGDNYCLIGPYNPATAAMEFEEQPTMKASSARRCWIACEIRGLPAHYGRWLIPGRPRVILLDYRGRYRHRSTHDKYLMWKDHGITCPTNNGEVNEVGRVRIHGGGILPELSSVMTDRPILRISTNGWAASPCLRIAHLRLPVTTVFTTHATLLGRYLAGDNPYFYEHLPYINADLEADKYQILRQAPDREAAAHASTVFTTVSEVTDREAARLLGRKPTRFFPTA